MRLAGAIEIYKYLNAVGTSEGAKKGWDQRGRGGREMKWGDHHNFLKSKGYRQVSSGEDTRHYSHPNDPDSHIIVRPSGSWDHRYKDGSPIDPEGEEGHPTKGESLDDLRSYLREED